MRIAFVSDSVSPWNTGGLETLEHEEADALSKEHDVHFFSLKWPGMKSEFKKDGITYHSFHDIDRSKFYRHYRRSVREAVFFTFGLVRIFKYRFDVVHSNEFPILQLPLLKFYCLLTGCKLLVDVHEVWHLTYWNSYLGRFKGYIAYVYSNWALSMADHYIANATETKRRLGEVGIPAEKVTIFAPTIDDEKMTAVKEGPRKREIIYAGRLIKEKRLDKWLDVVAKTMKLTKVRGVIIGEGPDRENIERLIKKMKLQRKVELRNFYSGKNKQALFRRIKDAGLFLHMSEREGLSLVTLESIALGTPVLLPSYTPIPIDAKDMCIVADEKALPKIAANILNGQKADYIPNSGRIARFYTSRILSVYGEIFRKVNANRSHD
jgi:glycosyltransferase involved in cell wall biosynthesis